MVTLRYIPRAELSRTMERAWVALWDAIDAVSEWGGYSEISFTPVSGANPIRHLRTRAPRRWVVVRCKGASYPYEAAGSDDTYLQLRVATVYTADPQIVVRVW